MPYAIICKGGSKDGQQEQSASCGRCLVARTVDERGVRWTEFYNYESYDKGTDTLVAVFASREKNW